jgi:hypothetical protein
MAGSTAAGATLAISAAAPATKDAAGFAALSFTEVGGVEKIGSFGSSFEKVDFQPLKGPKEKYKGPVDYGALNPSIAIDRSDAGQTLMRTAADDETQKLYSTRVTFPDGSKGYSQVRVFGMPDTVDAAASMLMANPTCEICAKPVFVPAA